MNGEMSPAIASSAVPSIRIAAANQSPIRPEREFVLYWMTAFRRTSFNFALERAVEWSAQLAKPLIVLEALRVDYPWASDRIHRFIVDGMADNQRRIAETPAVYYPYIERAPGEGKGLVAALGAHACVVVTDDFPAFFGARRSEGGRATDRRSAGGGRLEWHPRAARARQGVQDGPRLSPLATEQYLRGSLGLSSEGSAYGSTAGIDLHPGWDCRAMAAHRPGRGPC